jgi:hypothetical protein
MVLGMHLILKMLALRFRKLTTKQQLKLELELLLGKIRETMINLGSYQRKKKPKPSWSFVIQMV